MRNSLIPLVLAISALSAPLLGASRVDTWTDHEGKKFKGEPTGIYGPLAMFKTSKAASRGIPLRSMSAQDCVRFYEAISELPEKADDWAQATAPLSQEIFREARQRQGADVAKVDLSGRPEPEFYMLVFGTNGEQYTWDALNSVVPTYERLKARFGDVFEALFIGIGHNSTQHALVMNDAKIPFLTNNIEVQERMSRIIMNFRPVRVPSILILNRHQTVMYGSSQNSTKDIEQAMTQFETLLVHMQPGRASNVPDLQNYLKAVQPVRYKNGKSEPILLAQPLDVDALKNAGIKRVDANFTIAPDHSIADVKVFDNGGVLPANLVDQLAAALRNSVFVAAVENGKFVEGVYEMHLVPDL
jgi:hypothetical protein